ncbi:hypothetical protein, partial [Sphingobacterium faecium]
MAKEIKSKKSKKISKNVSTPVAKKKPADEITKAHIVAEKSKKPRKLKKASKKEISNEDSKLVKAYKKLNKKVRETLSDIQEKLPFFHVDETVQRTSSGKDKKVKDKTKNKKSKDGQLSGAISDKKVVSKSDDSLKNKKKKKSAATPAASFDKSSKSKSILDKKVTAEIKPERKLKKSDKKKQSSDSKPDSAQPDSAQAAAEAADNPQLVPGSTTADENSKPVAASKPATTASK